VQQTIKQAIFVGFWAHVNLVDGIVWCCVVQDDIITYVARCLYVECGRCLQQDVVKSKMTNYFPRSYLAHCSSSTKARDALARNVMASFDKQGFSGYAVPAKYVSIVSILFPLCQFHILTYLLCVSVLSVIVLVYKCTSRLSFLTL